MARQEPDIVKSPIFRGGFYDRHQEGSKSFTYVFQSNNLHRIGYHHVTETNVYLKRDTCLAKTHFDADPDSAIVLLFAYLGGTY
jgi:hypothetical protein